MKCLWCNNDFSPKTPAARYCCPKCRDASKRWRFSRRRMNKIVENGIEGEDYIIDKWNGLPVVRLYGEWMKHMHPDKSIDDYKKEFPGAPLSASKDIKNTSKHSGEWMKTDEYKKIYSEMFKGENNPMHKSKTSDSFRKSNSPFSIEFYRTRGLDETLMAECVEKAKRNRGHLNTEIEYYIERGYTKEESEKILSIRQNTRSLEKTIEKYGEEDGMIIYKKRNSDWTKNMKEKYANGEYSTARKNTTDADSFSSCIERKIFNCAINLANIPIEECKFAKNNKNEQLELVYFYKNKCHRYLYDFSYKNKIIEFNGDFWHMNPNIYNENYINPITNKVAKDVWRYDENKINCAIEHGYDVMVIWESDYYKDKDKTINSILKFINV